MRQFESALFLALLLAFTGNAEAKPCPAGKAHPLYDSFSNNDQGVDYSKAEEERIKFEKSIDQRHANDGNPSALYFVVPAKKKGEKPTILTYVLPAGEHTQIDKATLDKLNQLPEVTVYNKTGKDLYFLRYTDSGLRGADPQYDFRAARIKDRWSSPGCSVVNFKDLTILSAVSGSFSTWGNQIADIQRDSYQKAMTQDQYTKYVEAATILKKKFRDISSQGRSIAVADPHPYGDKVDNRLEKVLDLPFTKPINVDLKGTPYQQKLKTGVGAN